MTAPRLPMVYSDGVGLHRCEYCQSATLSTADAETLRTNLSAIADAAKKTNQPAIEELARLALSKLQS